MDARREAAFKLRMQGKSYNEIHAEMGVPKSTLSSWFQGLILPDAAQERINKRVREGSKNGLIKKNKRQTIDAQKRARDTQYKAKKEIEPFTERELLLMGAVFYWAEGHKRLQVRNGKELTSHAIRFSNVDPGAVRLFIRFLVEICEVPKEQIVLIMHLHAHINETEARQYWMDITKLPENQFRKTSFQVSSASKLIRPHNSLPFGTLQVEVYSTEKFHHIMGWIEGVKEQIDCDIMPVLLG